MERLDVDLGDRSYEIRIGSGQLSHMSEALDGLSVSRALVVSDATVAELYAQSFMDSLGSAGVKAELHVVPPGEASKSFASLQSLLDAMFTARLSRDDVVMALGGGVVGDLAGFAAAIYKRGCRLIQLPTTLLAQVDSSVGGKTAINVSQGKNLVGAFHQPDRVIIDTDVLTTLDQRDVKSGYAEILKYALIDDPEFFDWLETHGGEVLALKPDALSHAILTSCRAKARVVAADEREEGSRALLNLGHTFAHALERVAGYGGDLRHGEAVSAGLAMAFEFSHRLNLCSAEAAAKVAAHLRALDMERPSTLSHYLGDPDALLSAMAHDKKNRGQDLTLILVRDIGGAFIERQADPDALADYLNYLKVRHVH